VVLHTGEQIDARAVCELLQWQKSLGSVAELEAALRERRWCAVRLRSIPNSRLTREVAAQSLIEASDERTEAGILRRQLNEPRFEEVDPEKFWEWGEVHGYEVQVSPGEKGCFEVQLIDRARAAEVLRAVPPPDATKPWSTYATDPLEHSFRQQLIPQLRDYLKERLPEYMIPSAWVALKQLPLTPNGKVDRRSLPTPQSRPEDMGEYIAPRTELERTLTDIWAQLLRVDQVGIQDNFFELGGHSLLATRVVTHLRHVLDIDLPIRVIFERPTVEALTNSIVQQIAAEVSMEEP
jgi:acyl carrier protein